jgi:uncharacterized protein
MGKLIVLVLLVVIAIWLIRRALRSGEQGGGFERKPPVHGDLVSCAHCGVHLPRSEARTAGDRLYCSEEHAQLGPGRR